MVGVAHLVGSILSHCLRRMSSAMNNCKVFGGNNTDIMQREGEIGRVGESERESERESRGCGLMMGTRE